MAFLELKGVEKFFAQHRAIKGIDLQIQRGEFIVFVGPSGCGKSTLLNMGSGLYLPSEGEVWVGGERVTQPVRKVSFMLQKDLLLPWRSIVENVMLGVEQVFWGVKFKPGKPLFYGKRDETRFFGLPGNPVSAMVCFDLFVRPAMAAPPVGAVVAVGAGAGLTTASRSISCSCGSSGSSSNTRCGAARGR